ncbi:hypothetical protein FHS34_004812 [Streptomyces echinatus]|uniref:Uncharacterized protein n=1 Tax=Streptomyces echinatus TaxID=67293 RepID=A0A7W9USB0_9ACTN|nr:hypothetical protein [Streptomyces echinatus]
MRAEGRSPIIALLAIVQSFDPALVPMATICLLLMAAGLGTASGSVFAPVARVTPSPRSAASQASSARWEASAASSRPW